MSNTVRYLPAQVLFPLLQLLLVVVWAHVLPEDDLGIAVLSIAMQDILYASIFTTLSQYTLRHLTLIRRESSGAFLSWEPWAVLVAACFQILIALPLIALYFEIWDQPWLCLVLGMQGVTRSALNYFGDRARADGLVAVYSIIQIGSTGCGLIASVCLILLYGASVEAAVAGVLLAQICCLVVALAWTDFGRKPWSLTSNLTGKVTRYGVPIAFATLLTVAVSNAPRFIVDNMFGLSLAGSFAVSYALGLRLSSLVSMMVTAGAYPAVVRKFESEGLTAAYDQLRINTLLLLGLTAPTCVGLAMFSQPISSQLLPSRMVELATVVVPLAVISGMLRDVRMHCLNQVFSLRYRTGYTLKLSLLDFVLSMCFLTAGTIVAGLTGLLLGLITSSFFSMAISMYVAKSRLDYDFPFAGTGLIMMACAAMAIAGFFMPEVSALPLLIGEVVMSGLIYVVVIAIVFHREVSGAMLRLKGIKSHCWFSRRCNK